MNFSCGNKVNKKYSSIKILVKEKYIRKIMVIIRGKFTSFLRKVESCFKDKVIIRGEFDREISYLSLLCRAILHALSKGNK